MKNLTPSSIPLKRLINDLQQAIFTPKPYLSIPEWAEQNRILPPSSPIPGRWSNDFNPLLIAPMEALSPHSPTQTTTLMVASQFGKTEATINAILYYLKETSSSLLFVLPNENLTQSFAKERLWNQLDGIANTQHGTSSLTHIESFTSTLDLVSSQSPSELSSRPKKIVFLDEIDRMPNTPEGCPVKLAIQRSQNFYNRKILLTSTPTIEGESKIHSYYLQGTQEVWMVQCQNPTCNHRFKLDFHYMRFEDRNDLSTTHIECPKCKTKYYESDRISLIKTGYWFSEKYNKPSNELTPKQLIHRSFWASAVYSPFVSLSSLMAEFLSSKENPATLQTFINLKLGLPWKQQERPSMDYEVFMRKVTPINLEPFTVWTAGIDIQGNRVEGTILGYSPTLNKLVVAEYFSLHSLEEVLPILQKYNTNLTLIDAGFNTDNVYKFVSRFPSNLVRAIKGVERMDVGFKFSHDLPSYGTPYRHVLWLHNTHYFKPQIHEMLQKDQILFHDNEAAPLTADYFQGLLSEEYRYNKNKNKWQWVKIYPRNEPWDTLNYAYAALVMLGVFNKTNLRLQGIAEFLDKVAQSGVRQSSNNQPVTQPQSSKPKPQQTQQSFNLWKNPGLKR